MNWNPELDSRWTEFGAWMLVGTVVVGLTMLVVRWILAGIDGRDDDND